MIKQIKDNIRHYNKHFKHGTLVYIAMTLMRIVIFPLMLLRKLWMWVYYSDD